MWLAAREGVFRSSDSGDNWEHVLVGLPSINVAAITYDVQGNRLLAASSVSPLIYESTDGGHRWRMAAESSSLIRSIASHDGKLFVTTAFEGVLAQSDTESGARVSAGGGGN
jgi:ligand-binding sensor domain-containing protein